MTFIYYDICHILDYEVFYHLQLQDNWFTYDMMDAFQQKVKEFSQKKQEEVNDISSLQPEMPVDVPEDEHPTDEDGSEEEIGLKDDSVKDEMEISGEEKRIKRRGGTKCQDVHGMDGEKLICVEWNDVGQPVGPGGRSLRTFIGTVGRNADKLPISYPTWKKIPNSNKDDVWDYIKVINVFFSMCCSHISYMLI